MNGHNTVFKIDEGEDVIAISKQDYIPYQNDVLGNNIMFHLLMCTTSV